MKRAAITIIIVLVFGVYTAGMVREAITGPIAAALA